MKTIYLNIPTSYKDLKDIISKLFTNIHNIKNNQNSTSMDIVNLIKKYTISLGYEQIKNANFFLLVMQKKVNGYLYRVYISDSLLKNGVIRISIINYNRVIVEFSIIQISDFIECNNIINIQFDNLYRNLCQHK